VGGTEPESNAVTTLVRRLRQRLQAVGAKGLAGNSLRYGLPPKPSIAQAESVPDLCLVVVVAIWLVGSHCQSILIVFAGVVYHREVEDQIQAFDKLLYKKKQSDGSSSRYSVLSGSVVVNLKDVPHWERCRLIVN